MKLKIVSIVCLSLIILSLCSNVKVKHSGIDIDIDVSDKIGTFHEKVLYSLKFDNNELKTVSLNKTLPQIESQFFDLKVTSNDVKILKYEIKEDTHNFNKNNKVLNVIFEPKEMNNFNQGTNFNQGMVNIEYSYKVKDLVNYKENKTVKSSFYLKDVGIYKEFSNDNGKDYPAKFSINIKNLPDNTKVKRVEFDGLPVDIDLNLDINAKRISDVVSENRNFSLQFKRNFNDDKNIHKLHFIFEQNNSNKYNSFLKDKSSQSSSITSIPSLRSIVNSYNEEQSQSIPNKDKKYTYYKKKNQSAEPSVLETIAAALMVLAICYLCCNCCTASDVPIDTKAEHPEVGPDGYAYYYS